MENTRLAVNTAEIAADVLDGEAVLINLTNGMYYSLVGSGSFIWSCIEGGLGKDEILTVLTTQYDVPATKATTDLDSLLEDLLREGLVIGTDEVQAAAPPQTAATPQSYETPRLKVFSDMQALLALDPPMPDLTDAPWKDTDDAHQA